MKNIRKKKDPVTKGTLVRMKFGGEMGIVIKIHPPKKFLEEKPYSYTRWIPTKYDIFLQKLGGVSILNPRSYFSVLTY